MSDPMTPMPDHLSAVILSALADSELSPADLAATEQHLSECSDCTRRALNESLLKRAAARAGQRYAMPDALSARIQQTIAAQQDKPLPQPTAETSRPRSPAHPRLAPFWLGALAALLLLSAGGFVANDLALRSAQRSAVAEALVTESIDEHIAAMAAAAPQVVSTDRHTVKPWFQGKLPFSFNLPATLPSDTTLDGANLVQLNGAPAAELLFSIGKHHASIFLRQRAAAESTITHAERNGFTVEGFRTTELDALAVSDADPSRLHSLALAFQQAQSTP